MASLGAGVHGIAANRGIGHHRRLRTTEAAVNGGPSTRDRPEPLSTRHSPAHLEQEAWRARKTRALASVTAILDASFHHGGVLERTLGVAQHRIGNHEHGGCDIDTHLSHRSVAAKKSVSPRFPLPGESRGGWGSPQAAHAARQQTAPQTSSAAAPTRKRDFKALP
jgi:hypothetical protein